MKTQRVTSEKNRSMEAFFAAYIRNNARAYIIAASVVLALELIMLVRGMLLFDFEKPRHQFYFVSYLFLIAATAAALLFVFLNRKEKVTANAITLVQHLYCTAIIAWSLLVTYLDMIVGNAPVVYMTVIMSVGGLMVLHPTYYAVNLFFSYGALLWFSSVNDMEYFYEGSHGGYINLTIFVLVSLLLSVRQYRVSRRELELSQHLEALSFRDQLTGIFNRRMFDEEVRRIEEADEEALLGIFDFDAFKTINDTYGHDFGDECLIEVASRLHGAFGERAYRIGGDEFTVLCAAETRETIIQKLAAINHALEIRYPEKDVSISGGFALRRAGSRRSMDEVSEQADKALYEAKRGGKKRVCFAEDA